MPARTRLARMLSLALTAALAGCLHAAPTPDMRGAVRQAIFPGESHTATVPFLFDGDRIYVEVSFIMPDGSPRKALAWVNMGSGSIILSNALFRAGRQHEFLPLVGMTHMVTEPVANQMLFERIVECFDSALKP